MLTLMRVMSFIAACIAIENRCCVKLIISSIDFPRLVVNFNSQLVIENEILCCDGL